MSGRVGMQGWEENGYCRRAHISALEKIERYAGRYQMVFNEEIEYSILFFKELRRVHTQDLRKYSNGKREIKPPPIKSFFSERCRLKGMHEL